MNDECALSPSRFLLQAFGEFNRGDWFECHETLEDLWIGSQGEIRCFYQGILQIAVALHHWRKGNFGGAVSLLTGGAGYLRQVRPVCQRIEVDKLILETERCRAELLRLGEEQMGSMAAEFIPRLRLAPAEGDEFSRSR